MAEHDRYADVRNRVEEILAVATEVDHSGDLAPFEAIDPYAEDAVYLPPGREPLVGREGILAHLRGVYDGGPREWEWDPHLQEVLVGGDLAVYYFRNHGTKPADDGGVESVTTDSLGVLELQDDGVWRLRYAIFNTDR